MSVKTILINGVRCWDVDGEILPILCGMTTLAVDAPRTYELGDVNSFPVVTLDIIYEGAAVGLDSSGNARPLVAGDKFVGFAEHIADNSAGAAGAVRVRVRRFGLIRLPVTGVTALTDVGSLVYASDDNTFTLTESTNSLVGRIVRWDVSTTCYVAFNAQGHNIETNVADVAAATAVALTGTLTGTANGSLVDVAAAAGACAGGSTPTAAQVDTAIATAVAPIVTGVNEQNKELQAQINALIVDVAAIRTIVNALI
jgi:hypothetical protein